MKKIRDYKIRQRLNILLSTILVIVFTVFGFLLINNQKNKILSDTQLRMFEQVQDLSKLIELHVQDNQHMVSSISNLVVDVFNMGGELKFHSNRIQSVMGINQVSKEKKEYTIRALEYNGDVIFQNYTFVDDIQNKTNATATIFQRIDDGFLRISTNIKKLNGERATGTYIPNSSPVIQTILKGETYRGRAFVVNDWYLTSYIPMKVNGKIEAIIYVGVYEKDLEMLSDFFLEKK
ncbi:MAG: Cache 3/Cache 2 fusion domain-containing protein, partial [Bacteroidales bacterium]|nr:Cache 3/Cache 2 fusion domain-containing protein [Bacteroidales bacterium]